MFGGNSNWRGPIWFPVNYLLITALRKYHAYFGDRFVVECPVGSGRHRTLAGVADELAERLGTINYEVVTRISPFMPRVVTEG